MGDINNLNVSWRTLILFGFWVPILLVAFQLFFRELEQSASRHLAGFCALFAIGITPQIIGFSGFYQVWPGLTFAPFNTDLWLGPLLLLHLRRLCLTETQFKNGLSDRWLLLPGTMQTLYYSVCFTAFEDYKAKFAYTIAFHDPYVVPVETTIVISLTIVCLWQCYLLMQEYRRFLNNTQSQADSFVPIWFQGLYYGLLILCLTWFSMELLSLLLPEFSYSNQYPFYLVMAVITLCCGLKALSDIRTPFPKQYLLSIVPEESTHDNNSQWQQKAESLITEMEKNNWYLETDLTLKNLASYLGTNQTYLSRTINEGLSQNFNQFVNQFRVRHAQRSLLKEPNLDMLDVAFSSGFNSKASFNRIFKFSTQMTPGQYRLKQRPNS